MRKVWHIGVAATLDTVPALSADKAIEKMEQCVLKALDKPMPSIPKINKISRWRTCNEPAFEESLRTIQACVGGKSTEANMLKCIDRVTREWDHRLAEVSKEVRGLVDLEMARTYDSNDYAFPAWRDLKCRYKRHSKVRYDARTKSNCMLALTVDRFLNYMTVKIQLTKR